MIYRKKYNSVTWINLESPDTNEMSTVAQELGLSERLKTELSSATATALTVNDEKNVFMVLHFPMLNEESREVTEREIDIVVGDSFILTTHYEINESLSSLRKSLETREIIEPDKDFTRDDLVYLIFTHLYSSVKDEITYATNRLKKIEKDMFGGKERYAVRPISQISREFLNLDTTLAYQEVPLEKFFKALMLQQGNQLPLKEYAERIMLERAQIARMVKTYREVTSELRETNVALLEVGQNETIKALTVINVIFLPLELTAFIFGMNVPGTPFDTNPNAFWIIITIMISVSVAFVALLIKKRWVF